MMMINRVKAMRSWRWARVGLAFCLLAIGCDKPPASPTTATAFTTTCFEQNFPLALKIADAMVPNEIKFFCAAPWNFDTFQHVKDALQERHFDIVESAVRQAPSVKQAALREAMAMAQGAADAGPPHLGVTWYVQKVLPMLHALKFRTEDEAIVVSNFSAADLAIMRAAATAINWQQPALAPSSVEGTAQPTADNGMVLADVPRIILSTYKTPSRSAR